MHINSYLAVILKNVSYYVKTKKMRGASEKLKVKTLGNNN